MDRLHKMVSSAGLFTSFRSKINISTIITRYAVTFVLITDAKYIHVEYFTMTIVAGMACSHLGEW